MKRLITRADDFGSAEAANRAIFQALAEGEYVKNVSCMAVGPCIKTDAYELEELRKKKDFCIGLHATINSEWEAVHYTSVLPPEKIPTLVDGKGIFAMHPMMFQKKMPSAEEAIKEISAQLDRLTALGLTIEYIDTHMLPDTVVPGMLDLLSEFAEKKGVIDQRWYYTFPSQHQPVLTGDESEEEAEEAEELYHNWFQCLKENKQYINILHPAIYSEETKKFYNYVLIGDSVAKSRHLEQKIINSGKLEQYCHEMGIKTVKYTEADPQGDTTMDAAKVF